MKHIWHISYIQIEIGPTVDGRNLAPVDRYRLSHYLQGFIQTRWCRIFSINSIATFCMNVLEMKLQGEKHYVEESVFPGTLQSIVTFYPLRWSSPLLKQWNPGAYSESSPFNQTQLPSVEQWKKPRLFRVYRGWNPTQLCEDYFINHEMNIPFKQPGPSTSWKEFLPTVAGEGQLGAFHCPLPHQRSLCRVAKLHQKTGEMRRMTRF